MSERVVPESMRLSRWSVTINRDVARTLGLTTEGALEDLITDVLDHGGSLKRVIKEDRRTKLSIHQSQNRAWIVKRFGLSPVVTWVYNLFHKTPAWREYYGALCVEALGCRTNPPLALAHGGGIFRSCQALVLPYVEGRSLHEFLRDMEKGGQERLSGLAESIGQQLAMLTGGGIVNRDYKPSNLIVDRETLVRGSQPILIDPAGLRVRRSDMQVYRMVAVLMRAAERARRISPRLQLRVLRAMLEGDATLGQGRSQRLKYVAMRVQRILDARPLSYDPDNPV